MITSGAIQGISLVIFKSLWETKDEAYKLLSQRLSQAIFYASEEYKENFILRHGFVRQEGFRPSVSLDNIYIEPHFIDQADLVRRAKEPHIPYEEIDYLVDLNLVSDGAELSHQYSRLIVKGEQGIGKTTFLKKIGLDALSSPGHSKLDKRYIPVFIQIAKQFNEELDLKAMIEEEFEACGFPEHEEFVESALRKGKLLILIDELDAAPLDLQDKLLLKIKDFSDSYSLNRFIITCRTFKKTHALSRFHETLLLGFSSYKAQQYIQSSLDYEKPTEQERQEIWKQLTGSGKTTKYIIHNPFGLSIALSLCQRGEHRILGQTFLYDKVLSNLIAIDAVTESFNDVTANPLNSFGTRLKVLSEMAYICLKSGRNKFHKMEIYRLYSAVLEKYSIQQNLPSIDYFKEEKLCDFIAFDDSGLCQFINPMIQRLLVAHHLMENFKSQDEAIERYLNDSDWKDVFIFLSGMQGVDYLLDSIQAQLSGYLKTERLSSFIGLIDHLSEQVNFSQDKVVNRCYAAFMIFDIIFLFAHRQHEQKIVAKILRKIRRIIDLLEPDSYVFSSMRPTFTGKPQLSIKHLIDPKILRGFSLERLFDLALILSKKSEEYGLIYSQESKMLFSTITRLKVQLKNKSMSSYHRKVCESNLYKLWLKALKVDEDMLQFTVDELQSIFLYYQSIFLIFCCMKEAFYISGRASREVGEILFSPRAMVET